jgi:uncharacterized membrane protein
MTKLFTMKPDEKYRLTLFLLLASSSVMSIAVLAARAFTSESYRYLFLVWNLILAWIPFLLAWVAYVSRRLPKFLMLILTGGSTILWLLFLPNAPYILTDFQHLAHPDPNVPVWYDVIMLVWFGWNGLLLGIISLYFMQEIVLRLLGKAAGWIFVTIVTALSSLGMYVGRFLRWNSWDVVGNPLPLASDILDRIIHPFSHPRTLTFTVLFTLFFLFIYVTIYVFGHLMSENKTQATERSF